MKKRGTCYKCRKRRVVEEVKSGLGKGRRYCKKCRESEPNIGNRFFVEGVEVFPVYGEPE